MLVDPIDAPDDRTADDLRREYEADLAAVVESVGVEAAAEETGISAATLSDLVDGADPDLSLDDACAIVALTEEWPDAETVRLEVRDRIMLGMSSAILDVDALEREADLGLEARDIQAKIEGRQPMSLAEYATVVLVIERENEFV